MEYIVVYGRALDEIIKKVNEMIKQGWQPHGGVCVDVDHHYQAMTRGVSEPK